MNKFSNKYLSQYDSDQQLLADEKQTLIDEDELDNSHDSDLLLSNGSNQTRIRHRNGISSKHYPSHELKTFKTPQDLISEPLGHEFTYYDIQPSDTLHNICLRFACSLNHVKRLNGLINDQDFYGLRKLKLPLGKLGLLKDFLQANNNVDDGISTEGLPKRNVISPGSALPVKGFRPLINRNCYSCDQLSSQEIVQLDLDGDRVTRVFEDLDQHVERVKFAAEQYPQKEAEIVKELLDKAPANNVGQNFRQSSNQMSRIPELFFCNENLGLNPKKIFVILFVVCIFAPLMFLISQSGGFRPST